MNQRLFAKTIEELFILGKTTFALGDPANGWDCLNSLLAFYEKIGVEFPYEWRGYTRENYAEKWRSDEVQCRKDYADWLSYQGEKLNNPKFMQPGDLLIFEGKEIKTFPAIFLGNGKMFMVFQQGAFTVPYKFFKSKLKEVRRLV